MTRLPTLERQLEDAARRLVAADRSPAAGAAADEPGPTRRPALRPRWRRRAAVVAAAVTGVAVVGGAAVAATGLLESGPAVPDTGRGGFLDVRPGTEQVLSLRAPDPDGGPAWGLRVFATEGEPGRCAQAGRVQGERIGVVGRDGVFGDDGRFHPLTPAGSQRGACSAVRPDGQLFMIGYHPPQPASGYSGDPTTEIGGCLPTRASRLPDVPVCAADGLRIVEWGFAGEQAERVVLEHEGERREQIPVPGESGAYLFVLRANGPDAPRPTLIATYRDGTVCRWDSRGPQDPTRCSPPPGLRDHG